MDIIKNPFRASGTFNGESYVEREADREIYNEILKNNRYLYFLAPRQSGKSSLIEHIRNKLDNKLFSIVFIDLSEFPTECFKQENAFNNYFIKTLFKYYNFEMNNENQCDLKEALIKILNYEVKRILVFIDEVDRLLDSTFKDGWFGRIRSFFNMRTTEHSVKFEKVQFILSGAATIASLISDSNQSPFNVGKAIELCDFSLEQTNRIVDYLKKGPWELCENAAQKIYDYTSGSVYLTQLLLEKVWDNAIEERKEKISESDIEIIAIKIISESSSNMHFRNIRRIFIDTPNLKDKFLMAINGVSINIEDHERLKIIGILDEKNDYRNRIYRNVFGGNGELSIYEVYNKKSGFFWKKGFLISLMGPRASGKTVFLIALYHEILQNENKGWKIQASDEPSSRYIESSTRDLLEEHQFPQATIGAAPKDRFFRYDIKIPGTQGLKSRVAEFDFLDPGGEIFDNPELDAVYDNIVFGTIKYSTGIICMIDSTLKNINAHFSFFLKNFFWLKKTFFEERGYKEIPIPVAFCITKMDYDYNFIIQPEEYDIDGLARELIGEASFQLIVNHLKIYKFFGVSSIGWDDDYKPNITVNSYGDVSPTGKIRPVNVLSAVEWLLNNTR